MLRGGIGNAVLAPVSEVLARLVVQIVETAMAAKDVLIEQESFAELAGYLEKIQPVLKELQDKNVRDTPPMRHALEGLERQMRSAQELIKLCKTRSKIYLLVKCRTLVKQVQDITHEIGRCLSLIPMATMNISVDSRETTSSLLVAMQKAEFRAAVADEAIVEKIETGIKDQRRDTSFANDLLAQIAEAVGASADSFSLSRELEEFRREKEEAEVLKNLQEAFYLDQIMDLLSRVEGGSSSRNRQKQNGAWHGREDALSTFYCPLTKQVMTDPVEIASGQTFERNAIEKWFGDGKHVCPQTSIKLENLEMKPNIALRHLIEEWKEMHTRSLISSSTARLESSNEAEAQSCLRDLYHLSEERPRYRTLIGEAGLTPVLVNLLKSKQRTVRKKTLATLCSLAADHKNKERILEAEALSLVVKSLARDAEEVKEAVALLLELSKVPKMCDQIGKTQGCVLLLATILRSEETSAAQEASALLDKLSCNSQYVVQMAEANYFKPLAVRLKEGQDMEKILMASAIARIGLTDQGKLSLAQDGAIQPLAKMLAMGSLEAKSAALGAIQKLSTLSENTDQMIKTGLVPHILKLLCSVTSSLVTLKEQAAATFANLATPAPGSQGNHVLESEDTLAQLLSLLNLAGPEIQRHLLRALHGISIREGATEVRKYLRAADAIQLLLPFCENADPEVRVHALKLLVSLSREGAGNDISEFLGPSSTKSLVEIISSSSSTDEEKAAAAGIFASLPLNSQVTDKLAQAGALPVIVNAIRWAASERHMSSVQELLLENVTGALLHFTKPSRDEMQHAAVKCGVIPCLVQLVANEDGGGVAKSNAATALGQFSEKTGQLSRPVTRTNTTWCCIFRMRREPGCKVHGGHCTVESSFCLVQAGAVAPLGQCLEEKETGAAPEAALFALSTLLHDNFWAKGADLLAAERIVRPLVKTLSTGSLEAKDRAVWMLERVFRVEKYRQEYGPLAQMPLVELAQRGSSISRPLVARILAHLGTLHTQSSYF